MLSTDDNSQKNDPAFKPPPRIEAGSSREKSTTPSTPYRLVVPFPIGQTSQGASQSTSTSQGASQDVNAMRDVEITSPMYIANVDVRARDDLLNRARDEPELNRDREGDRDREGERERNRAEGDGAEGDRTPATVDHRPLVLKPPIDKDETYLMTKDFNYAMTVLDDKINSLYRLCRYIGDQQQNMSNSLQKLVALDELSEQFWNVSYLIYYTTNLF